MQDTVALFPGLSLFTHTQTNYPCVSEGLGMRLGYRIPESSGVWVSLDRDQLQSVRTCTTSCMISGEVIRSIQTLE